MAPGGGYLAAPCHTLTEEVAWEGVLAFHDALRDYGIYPNAANSLAAPSVADGK
jgi:hypothetical protein